LFFYDTTTGNLEFFDGVLWRTVSTVAPRER